MSWRRINAGAARNERGVRVTRTGYKSLKYEDGEREIIIDVEPGNSDLGIYARSVKHWQPSGELVTPDERTKILEDVQSALRILEMPFAILWT